MENDKESHIEILLRVLSERQNQQHKDIMSALRRIEGKEDSMKTDLTALQTEVTNATTVEQGAITLIQGLAAAITAAGTDPAALASIVTQLNTSDTALAAAITANTPAAGS